MSTKRSVKSQELLEELLVYGYIRINFGHQFGKDILHLCLLSYHVDSYFMFIGDKCTLNHQTAIHYKGQEMTKNDPNGENIKHPNSCYNSIIMPSISETNVEYIYTLKITECDDIMCIGIDSTNGDYINDDFTIQSDTFHYSYYSKNGTLLEKKYACKDIARTFGPPFGNCDTIKMYYNPYKSKLRFKVNRRPIYAMYGIHIHKQIGLQYRLCIFMGNCGKQSIELVKYKIRGDVAEEEIDVNHNDAVAAAAVVPHSVPQTSLYQYHDEEGDNADEEEESTSSSECSDTTRSSSESGYSSNDDSSKF